MKEGMQMRFKKNIWKNNIFIYSFILISLLCIIYYFYYLNQKIQLNVNLLSEESFHLNFQISTFLLLFLIVIILLTTQYIHSSIIKANAHKLQSRDELEIVNNLYSKLQQFQTVRDISHQSLKFITNQLEANHATLYIVDYLNEQLHLSGEFQISVKNEERILPIYRGAIGEAVAFQKIKYIKTDDAYTVYIPLINDKQTIAIIILRIDTYKKNYTISPFHNTLLTIVTDFLRIELKNEENKKYFDLIDNYVITSSTNKEGVITYASKAFERFHGYKNNELVGKSHRIIKSDNIDDVVFKRMWESISKGNIWKHEIENKKKDSSLCWLNTTIQPEFDYYGNIIGYTAIRIDITDKKVIEKISNTDAMTNIYNRRFFDSIFPKQISLSRNIDKKLAFCMLDIDHFKQYNDTYGHQEGDIALIKVAKTLKKSLKREEDFIFRLGGEEFGMLYFIENANDAVTIANQTKENIENLQIIHEENTVSDYITVSIGLYIYDINKEDITPDKIYLKTDKLLYRSKQNGRNQVSF